ncbi:hypothetical protein NDU88_003199 [Pleurodeles waltl]|uniref:Uncharacterized protein n=1 Tax=Pleurodeles waltl TaxID=8319 RepID=A0AAV7TMW8_PLEWA|nr:hypothetical protein NDU88_003199 [Pleurodeles waltl]
MRARFSSFRGLRLLLPGGGTASSAIYRGAPRSPGTPQFRGGALPQVPLSTRRSPGDRHCHSTAWADGVARLSSHPGGPLLRSGFIPLFNAASWARAWYTVVRLGLTRPPVLLSRPLLQFQFERLSHRGAPVCPPRPRGLPIPPLDLRQRGLQFRPTARGAHARPPRPRPPGSQPAPLPASLVYVRGLGPAQHGPTPPLFHPAPGILLNAAARSDFGHHCAHSGATALPRASGQQGRPPLLPSLGVHLYVLISGLQRAEPLQLPLSPGGCRLRSASLLGSPAPAAGQAAGPGVRRPGPDPCNRAQTGLRGSPAGPLGSPPQFQHRLPGGRLAIFG